MEADIFHGDFLIVNRNLQARNGDKFVAPVNRLSTVKIFSESPNGLHLVASNGKYAPHEMSPKDDFEICGVVTHVIHSLKKIDRKVSPIKQNGGQEILQPESRSRLEIRRQEIIVRRAFRVRKIQPLSVSKSQSRTTTRHVRKGMKSRVAR